MESFYIVLKITIRHMALYMESVSQRLFILFMLQIHISKLISRKTLAKHLYCRDIVKSWVKIIGSYVPSLSLRTINSVPSQFHFFKSSLFMFRTGSVLMILLVQSSYALLSSQFQGSYCFPQISRVPHCHLYSRQTPPYSHPYGRAHIL